MLTVAEVLATTREWPVPNCAAGVVTAQGEVIEGAAHHRFAVASLTKPVVAHAVLVAVEEGVIDLDRPLPEAQPGCTMRHLLAHTGGYPFEDAQPVAAPGTRRIYSNSGFELAAAALERATEIDVATYVGEAVLEPLGMTGTALVGSPASGLHTSLVDLLLFMRELLHPALIGTSTALDAQRPQWPVLGGIVPGVGHFEPCPWGLGVEIAGDKSPHWMGSARSARTFGHFGGGGSMMWVDPDREVALVALTDRPFGSWAAEAQRSWAQLSDRVIASLAPPSPGVSER